AQQEQPMLPQTPNSAPTQKHFCHAKPVYPPTPTPRSTHPNQATNTTIEAMQANLRVCLHPAKTNNAAVTHSATQPQHPQLWAHKIKAP
ncbi:hypothetical protein MHJ86_11375, partial [Corynebacterium afermentans]|nr:hypothetical protein [Corynebacterium afermentans]